MSEEHRARNVLYQQLMQVPHGEYGPAVEQFRGALASDPDLVARACVHVCTGGSKIRDVQDVAVITLLQAPSAYPEYREAGRCLLLGKGVYEIEPGGVAGLPPFRIFRVWDYVRKSDRKVPRLLKSAMTDYVRALEGNPAWFDGVAIHNRKALKAVYRYHHVKPDERAQATLFDEKPPADSKLAVLKQIANSKNPREQARLVIENKIPFRVATSVLPKMNAAVGVALFSVMSPQEALNSRAWAERSGLLNIPEVRDAFTAKIKEATASIATADHRKSAQGTDEEIQAAVEEAKQKAVDESRKIEKSTLFLGDKSHSMDQYFGVLQQIGSRVMPICAGDFMCILFNDMGQELRVEGNTLADWQQAFRGQRAGGTTSMKAGLDLALKGGFMPEQIIVATDGGENRGRSGRHRGLGAFAHGLVGYADQSGIDPNVVVVGLRDTNGNYHREFAETIRREGFTVDEFPPPRGEYDYNLFDQIVAVLGGPPALTLIEQILAVELPRRVT
jgi:hypothetical protein